jgi:hypothetical protein
MALSHTAFLKPQVPMIPHRISWINTPVLLEAIERYEQGRLPRPLALWLQTVLEIEAPPSEPLLPGG